MAMNTSPFVGAENYLAALGILFIPPAILIGVTKALKYIVDGFLK